MAAARPFATDRTRRFRQSELSDFNRKKISDIEEFACQVLSVMPSASSRKAIHGFSYTIGIFDTCGRPEVIVVGLPPGVAHSLLNEAARRLRQGVNLASGRHGNMLNAVDCEFRPVDPKWVDLLMLGANWYYKDDEYPVLQAVYPDLGNRFPEDAGFDRTFAQPLMQPNAPFTEVESEFRASTQS